MKLAVVGVGLIGGSFALAARHAELFSEIVGVDHDAQHRQSALDLGLCDTVASAAPADADAVLLAVPSSVTATLLAQLQQHRGLVFDVASVKGALLDAATRLPARFVPCHPIAGSERSGPEAAQAKLFTDHLVITTPTANSAAADVAQVSQWWSAVGASVQAMDPHAHDSLFARTSHLPHLVAFAYMQLIAPEQLAYAAGGFRDFSRIAASDPDMWAPILRMNQAALKTELAGMQQALSELGEALEAPDDSALRALIVRAQQRRRAFDER
ncbi:MAG: prephenate dehydrogenase [Pseudomonadales bacterium]